MVSVPFRDSQALSSDFAAFSMLRPQAFGFGDPGLGRELYYSSTNALSSPLNAKMDDK